MRQEIKIAVEKKNNTVIIGRSTVLQPKLCFKGGTVKWFDDSKLIKK